MASRKPLVSVVMVNWNGAEHLTIALPSLRGQSYDALEIIVVDNGSVDSSEEVASANQVRWLALGENRGLAGACNEGASRAGGEYLVFLNNDMRFPPNFVESLVAIIEKGKDVFAVDALQLNWDGTEQVHLATRLHRLPLARQLLGQGLIPGLQFVQEPASHLTEVMQASAASMVVRRSMFEQLGGFDPRLPVGWEDTDICWRAWLRGWRTVLVPGATCWHRVGASTQSRAGAIARFKGSLGGRLLFATKYLPWQYLLNTWAISLLAFGKDLASGRLRALGWRLTVLRTHVGLVPTLLRERNKAYREARLSPRAHLHHMLSLGSDAAFVGGQ
jgi:GT2 family glycosyltransferase